MLKKSTLINFFIILIIFLTGFILRIESTNLYGIPENEKSFNVDDNGLPYMYELDSYYNFRLTKNYIDHGFLGDTVIDNREWDLHSYYPPGVPMDYPPLIIYLTAYIHIMINIFQETPLLVVCFWLPAFIGPLAGIVAFLMLRNYTNCYGAFTAGILAVTVPIYFMRTLPGWFDTDMFNIIFPLLVVWFFMEAVHSRKINKTIFYSILAAFFIFMFSLAWNGWIFIFYLIVFYSLVYLLWCIFKGRKVNKLLYVLLIFTVGCITLTLIFSGWLNFLKIFLTPMSYLSYTGTGFVGSWPNIYEGVGELNVPQAMDYVGCLGVLLFTGILGLFWIMGLKIRNRREISKKVSWFFFYFLIVWTILGFLSITQGVRFTLIIIPPLIVSSGILIGLCMEYMNSIKGNENLKQYKRFSKPIMIFIIFLISSTAVFNAYTYYFDLNPGANDDMFDSFNWIESNTPENTVIISKWSYGHLFTAIADRSVIMDGRLGYIETLPIRKYDPAFEYAELSPNVYRDYWINKALSTSNENLSLGIFRMLSSSGDMAYITLDSDIKNTSQSVMILEEILGLNKEAAGQLLVEKYKLSTDQANEVLIYTHPENPKPYIVVTTLRMMVYGGDILNYGEWDFNTLTKSNYMYSVEDVEMENNSLKNKNGSIYVNINSHLFIWNNQTPYSFEIVQNGQITKEYLDTQSYFCLIYLPIFKKMIIIDRKFDNSTFKKLVIEGQETNNFIPLYKTRSVIVWGLK